MRESAPKCIEVKRDNKQWKKSRIHGELSSLDNVPLADQTPVSDIKQPDKGVIISYKVFVAAQPEHCFELLVSQLDELHTWDPMLSEVYPISRIRQQKDATSRLIFNLGGKKLDTLAIISTCDNSRNDSKKIEWVSNNEVRIKEEWLVKPEHLGTVVHFTLTYTFPGKLGRVKEKMISKKKVAQDVAYMIYQFRSFAEGRLVQ